MIEIIAFIITVLSFGYAVLENSERRRLQDFIRSEAWYLYSKSSNTNGQVQISTELYRKSNGNQLDPFFLESIGKADGFGQDLTRETIRLIQLTEPDFNRRNIELWFDGNKIHTGHKKLFEILVVEPKRKKWFQWKKYPKRAEKNSRPESI